MYQRYMSDMARYTVNNIAEYFGGTVVKKTYSDIIDVKPEEKRTAEQIIYSISSRLNGVQNEPI